MTAVAPSNAVVVALVAHARTVPSSAREAFAATAHELAHDERRIIVHTCHRVEVYSAGEPAARLARMLPSGGRRLDGQSAVHHLMRVACALESAVFGETEILHQVREAFEARRAGPLDPVLDRLFQVALRAGREARAHHTGPRRSLADVAVDLIPADPPRGGSLAERSVLVVGSGRMGRLAAIAAARRGAHVVVANRTAARAIDLARQVGGSTVAFEDPDLGAIPALAGVIVAIGGPWRIRGGARDELRRSRPAVIDLSSPPALDATLAAELGDRYVSVDEVAAPRLAASPRALAALERTADRAAAEFCEWVAGRRSVPVIVALSTLAEEHRRSELDRLRRRLPALAEEDLALVDQMSRRIVAAVLHEPLTTLGRGAEPELEPVVRRLFGL